MRHPILALLVSSLVLSSCGGWSNSRLNPTNWFGGSQESSIDPSTVEGFNPLIPDEDEEDEGMFSRPEEVDTSVLIAQISAMRIERTPTGAIIYAEGLATREGAFDADLVAQTDDVPENGVLVYEFRVNYPESATRIGTQATRTIRAAETVSNALLRDARTIRVIAEQNARESRR